MKRRQFLQLTTSALLVPGATWAEDKLHRTLRLDQATVELGGKDRSKFAPNINARKWGDEAWVNLNHRDTIVGAGAKQEIIGGRPTLTVGDVRHQMWQLGSDVLEYSITFAARPAKNYIELDIQQSAGLRWLYQAPLTEQQILDGHHRHPRVEGSLAVYYAKTGNIIGGPQYSTGKMMHAYRWHVTDANGKSDWCEPMKLDRHDGRLWLVIGLPAEWMRQATYPVRAMGAGDTFGNSDIGASWTWRSQDLLILKGYTGITGTATSVAAYVYDGNDLGATLGIYSGTSNPLALEGDTGEVTLTNGTPDWYSSDLDSSVSLSSGTTYYPAFCYSGTIGIYYDSDTNASDRVAASYVSGTLPATASPTLTESNLYSIYVTYTASGGAAIPQVI